jgi:hypothetical protein
VWQDREWLEFYPLIVPLYLGPDAGAFPRVYSDGTSVWVAYRTGQPENWRAVLLKDGVEVWRSPTVCGGNDPVCLGSGWFAWQDDVTRRIYRAPLTDLTFWTDVGPILPTGLSRILASGTVRLVDEDRVLVPGVTRPCWAGVLSIGEAPNGGALVSQGTKCLLLWPGEETFTPRLAWDGKTGYVAVTWGKQGIRLATFDESDLQGVVLAPAGTPFPTS